MIDKLKRLAKKAGLEVTERLHGHIQVKGDLLVNYYPDSKFQSAYIAGTTGKVKYATPEKVIEMAQKPPKQIQPKKRNYTAKQSHRWKKYLLRKRPYCKWCKLPLTEETATLEHIIPRARGGLDNMNNFTLACEDCNQERGPNMPEITSKERR